MPPPRKQNGDSDPSDGDLRLSPGTENYLLCLYKLWEDDEIPTITQLTDTLRQLPETEGLGTSVPSVAGMIRRMQRQSLVDVGTDKRIRLTKQGLEGSVIQMLSHGLISAALFLCVGVVYDRYHSRLISSYGGLVNVMPKYALFFMIFTLAALGMPGTSGFVGEFLILVGVFQVNHLIAVLASLGIILAAAYMLWLYKRVIFGKIASSEIKEMADLNKTEIYIFASLVFLTIFFGIYPEPLFNTIDISVSNLIDNYKTDLNFYLTQTNN